MISYEVYLECVKIGVKANPEPMEIGICATIYCVNCPLEEMVNCRHHYRNIAKNYYPILLTQNQELIL
jgi:hypothetical protein